MSGLLIDSRFVAVFPSLVRALGGDVTAAAVLQAIHYRNQDDTESVELPFAQIAEEIGISCDQARRATQRLRQARLLLTTNTVGVAKRWSVDYEAVDALAATPANTPESESATPANTPDLPTQPRRNRQGTPANTPHHPGEIAGVTLYIEDKEIKESSAPQVAQRNAGELISAFIDQLRQRPPNRVVGQLAREVRVLLDEGFSDVVIFEALMSLHTKGLHPASLASEVNHLVNAGGRKQSGTEIYLRAAQTLAEKDHPAVRALEAQEDIT